MDAEEKLLRPGGKRRAERNSRMMEQIASPENLLCAWRAVRGNIPRYRRVRSSGPDGVSLDDYERDLPAQLGALRQSLLKGTYQPHPPAVFRIRKRSGGERPLAVLSINDRVAQRAVQQVLEPIWEPHFLPCSYGFRPGLSTHLAVEKARELRRGGQLWVVDGDINACFNSLDHQMLLHRVETRVQDARVIGLLSLWITQGMLCQVAPARPRSVLAGGWERITGEVRGGAGRVINAISGSSEGRLDEYMDDEGYLDDMLPAENFPSPYSREFRNPYQPGLGRYRQNSLGQLVSSGLLFGANYARPFLKQAGEALAHGLRTTAGRELLKRGALAGGGLVGAALGLGAAAWLVYREFGPAQVGILQGSPLSPLLANIYLHAFDRSMTESGCSLVRYADDWVVCCPTELAAERAYNQAVVALAKIHLKVNAEKTHILPPAEPVEWLGERIEGVIFAPRNHAGRV